MLAHPTPTVQPHPLSPIASEVVDRVERIAFSPAETAEALGITRPTVYALIRAGKLRRFKVGSRTLIPVADVRALVGGGA